MYISYTHIVIGAAPLLIHIQQTGDFQVNQFPAPQQISAFFPFRPSVLPSFQLSAHRRSAMWPDDYFQDVRFQDPWPCHCMKLDDGWPESVEEQITQLLVSRQCNEYIEHILYAKEKNMLQMVSRKKKEMICQNSKLKRDEMHRRSFTRRQFHTHTRTHFHFT